MSRLKNEQEKPEKKGGEPGKKSDESRVKAEKEEKIERPQETEAEKADDEKEDAKKEEDKVEEKGEAAVGGEEKADDAPDDKEKPATPESAKEEIAEKIKLNIFSKIRVNKAIKEKERERGLKNEEEKKTEEKIPDKETDKGKPGKKKAPKPEELDIRKVFKKEEEKKHKKLSAAQRRRRLEDYLEKSGFDVESAVVRKRIFRFSIIIITIFTIFYIMFSIGASQQLMGLILQVLIIWTIGLALTFAVIWLLFSIYLDIMMLRRKLSIEEVLPDFLQLTSANIRAGMPIDKALWFAVRPRFGILAKEIEDVAKRTLSGDELNMALVDFAKKYDSTILLRSVNLMNEGMEAGGDVGDLLNKISINIQDLRSLRKEMSANVMTYVIFITFASIVAAPVLFGLSHELLNIVQTIAGDVSTATTGQSTSGLGLTINMSSDNIKISDYRIFAYVSLMITAFFSAIIVATIRKGSIKEDFELIPIFLVATVVIFFIATKLMGLLFTGVF